MRNIQQILKEKPRCINGIILLLILGMTVLQYWHCRDNYFFSDDFEWLARGILAQNLPDAPAEIISIQGRDFNPVFIILLAIMIRFFGLSAPAFRILSLLTFSLVIFIFYYILVRYFHINRFISFTAALLCGFNIFVSEVVLNMSALVYTLSLLLFLLALSFFWDGKRALYFIFLFLAFLTKETVILAAIPLIFYEKEKRSRLFIILSLGVLVFARVLLQWITAVPGKYTSFLGLSQFFYKLYFISLKSLGVSPYAVKPIVGAAILIILGLITGYFAFSKKIKTDHVNAGKMRGFLFFSLFFIVFALFFSLLPKLSSRYFFYPAFGLWGIAALLFQYGYEKNKKIRYILFLLLISLLFNYFSIKREIEDYKILGDFSYHFIRQQAALIANSQGNPPIGDMTLYKLDFRPLGDIYRQVKERGNLPKLLPFREHGLGGVIEPGHLIPIVFYPGKIVRWHLIKETSGYFSGRLEIVSESK